MAEFRRFSSADMTKMGGMVMPAHGRSTGL